MRKTALLIMAAALLQMVCLSLWGNDTAKSFTLGTRDSRSMVITFRVPEYEIEKELASGKTWDRIRVADGGYLTETGLPELPVMATMVAIPNHGQVSVEILNARTKMIEHIIPYPSQDDGGEEPPKNLLVNDAFYRSAETYPQETVKYSDPQILRDFRLITIQIRPFAWNAATRQLEVREEVQFRLNFSSAPGINELSGPQTISPAFANIYESLILNFGDYRGALMANTPPRYLMIYGAYSDQTFLTKVSDFAFWKKQKGADVRLVSTAVTGTTNAAIKAFIQNIYNDVNARPDFIVLIGDTSGSFPVPTWPENFSTYNGQGDYPYQHLAGNDYLGDVFLGRISAENTSQLDIILSKVYFYERYINVGTAQWLNKMLLVGDTSPSGQSCVYTNKYIKEAGLQTNPDYTFTELYSDNPSVDQMNQAINQGVGFFNYRGYINMSGWEPTPNLINGVKLVHSVIITCSTGTFYSGTSDTEAFIRLGTVSVPAGAVTSIGMATSGTHTMYNNALCLGIWNGILVHGMRTMGEALLNGKLVLNNVYSQSHPNTVKYFAHWCNLMGDPTMEVYTGIPGTFVSSVPDSLPMGMANLGLVILDQTGQPVQNACVTVSQGNLILARGYTDGAGHAVLFLNTPLNSGQAVITVSKHEFKPLQQTISIYGAGSLVASQPMIDDDNIGGSSGNGNYSANSGETLEILFCVRNTTISQISSVTGTVSSDNPHVTLDSNTVNFTTVDAGAANYSLIPVQVQISPACPNNTVVRFDLMLTDGSGNSYVYPDYVTVTDAFMNYVSSQVSDTNNQILDPDETVTFSITVKNNGTVPVNDLYGQLVTLNDLIQVMDDTGFFGNLAVGTQAVSAADQYQLRGRAEMLPGMVIPLRLRLYNAAGFVQWMDFSVTVGQVASTDPLGPDAYGYVIYDITDTGYEDCPVYEWVEISPSAGGPGTSLNLSDTGSSSDEGDTVGAQSLGVVNLPFTFRFYGEEYNQITVCSNGFITMGVTENGNYRNFHLPGGVSGGGGAPSPLIAPFWDDLITTGGGVYKWYDENNHRFIVEWHNCKNGYVQTATETFQVILHDPVYYPTTLGDGPIKIQYHTFNNVDTGGSGNEYSGNYSTIGIQNASQTIGLEYSFNNTYPTAAAPLGNQKALYITNMPVYHYTPHLLYDNALVLDNNNNVLEPGETVDLYVSLINIGEQTAQEINTTLSSTSPYVTVLDNASSYAPIPGEQLGSNIVPFRFSVSGDCPDGQQLGFSLQITTGTYFWTRTFNLSVEKPEVGFASFLINDMAGNNNGVADPGESVTLIVQAKNTSPVDAHGLTGTLSTTQSEVNITTPTLQIPALAAGETFQFAFPVQVNSSLPAGTNVPFSFSLTSADAPAVNQNFNIGFGTGGMVLDMEATDGYFVSQSGWAHGTPQQTAPHSGSKLWATNLTGQYNNNAMYILTTPVIALGDSATLTFWHMISCQNYWDGGNVSISADSGSMWTVLYPVGGYNTSFTISSLGEQGYTNVVNWAQATFNLNSYAGQNVILRWRFGSNASVQGTGWFIDDVMISGYFIPPGIASGLVTLDSGQDLTGVRVRSSSGLVTHPNTAGQYSMFLPQGAHSLTAGLPYHTSMDSPEFSLSPGQLAYSFNFDLDYLAPPSGLEYSMAVNDSTVHLTWAPPVPGEYEVLSYNIYRSFGDHPYQLMGQSYSATWSESLAEVGTYHYYVRPVYSVGDGAPSNEVEVVYNGVANPEENLPPAVNSLGPNYPNPFSRQTAFNLYLAKDGPARLRIYNAKGQLVRTLADGDKKAGRHLLVWDGRDNAGKQVSAGLYLSLMDAPGFSQVRKMMLVR